MGTKESGLEKVLREIFVSAEEQIDYVRMAEIALARDEKLRQEVARRVQDIEESILRLGKRYGRAPSNVKAEITILWRPK